mmetsp:Transcript_24756/g.50235  ORF Transcript_24756/g.50235 Transcript_24756/m.50235 type:complete len:123 (+) Transcript_24756:1313-1681(+)
MLGKIPLEPRRLGVYPRQFRGRFTCGCDRFLRKPTVCELILQLAMKCSTVVSGFLLAVQNRYSCSQRGVRLWWLQGHQGGWLMETEYACNNWVSPLNHEQGEESVGPGTFSGNRPNLRWQLP